MNCRNGETPLHYATRRGVSDIVELLLQMNASLDISGHQGNAMQIAVKENRHQVMDILNESK